MNLSWTIVNSKPILICSLTIFKKVVNKSWAVVNSGKLVHLQKKALTPPTKSPSFFLLLTGPTNNQPHDATRDTFLRTFDESLFLRFSEHEFSEAVGGKNHSNLPDLQ